VQANVLSRTARQCLRNMLLLRLCGCPTASTTAVFPLPVPVRPFAFRPRRRIRRRTHCRGQRRKPVMKIYDVASARNRRAGAKLVFSPSRAAACATCRRGDMQRRTTLGRAKRYDKRVRRPAACASSSRIQRRVGPRNATRLIASPAAFYATHSFANTGGKSAAKLSK